MIEQLLRNNPWFATIAWAITFISDYYLTIYGARLYQAGIKDYITYEGSYELTPAFQHDIDSFKLFSSRFVRQLILSLMVIWAFWWVSVQLMKWSSLFAFFTGGLILREFAIHMRHIRNIATFRYAKKTVNGFRGRIEFSRQFIYRLSAIELFSFAVLYLLMFAIKETPVFLGGVLACALTGQQHWAMSKKSNPQL